MYVASGHSITHDFLLLTPFPKITSPSISGIFMGIAGPPESHSWASSRSPQQEARGVNWSQTLLAAPGEAGQSLRW